MVDDGEKIEDYRFRPDYMMGHIGLSSVFSPTGGNLVFRMIPNYDNIERKLLGNKFSDIISLNDLLEILSLNKTKSRLISIYRPMLTYNEKIDLVSLVLNIRPFGVTSISKCVNLHKDHQKTVQPILINGACSDNKSDYFKQDTLRLPVSLVTIINGRVEDTTRFVFLTFKKSDKSWLPHFIITPKYSYVNEEMLESENMSFVYRLGLLDNIEPNNASIYMYKSMEQDSETMWFIENFVFNPNSDWQVYYTDLPPKFYDSLPNRHSFWNILGKDPSKESIIYSWKKKNMSNKDTDRGTLKRKYSDISESTTCNNSIISDIVTDKKKYYSYSQDAQQIKINIPLYLPPSDILERSNNSNLSFNLKSTSERKTFSEEDSNVLETLENEVLQYDNFPINVKSLSKNGDTVTLTAHEVYVILGAAFLDRLEINGDDQSFFTQQMDMSSLKREKRQCLMQYFKQCVNNKKLLEDRRITFSVRGIHKSELNFQIPLQENFEIYTEETKIEDCIGGIFADFANKKFGGGVFNKGSAQEEILLITHPETLVGRGLFKEMTHSTVCDIVGALRFSNYTGFRNNFAFDTDNTVTPSTNKKTRIVAFDALNFKQKSEEKAEQYSIDSIYREIVKAACAFKPLNEDDKSIFISGQWGCGVFNGDPSLKGLIQIIAATLVNRPIHLVNMTSEVKRILHYILQHAIDKSYSIEDLMDLIKSELPEYKTEIMSRMQFKLNPSNRHGSEDEEEEEEDVSL